MERPHVLRCSQRRWGRPGDYSGVTLAPRTMPNLSPLKFCMHGQHSKPRAQFRVLPGGERRREVCAECYEKIMAARKERAAAARKR